MTEATNGVNESTEVKKVVRRGVGSSRGTVRLKFDNSHASGNGLFIGHLDSVEVKTINVGEETAGLPSFAGCEIPKIVFTFASNEEDVTKRKYVTLQFNAVESNTETIPGGKDEWKVNQIFDYVKHFLDVYLLRGRELTDEENALLSLPFTDFNENGDYISLEVEEIIAGWKTFFTNVANVFNTYKDDKPIYLNKDNKPISVWIKLIRYFKTKKGWKPVNNGELSFPTFVGEGVIERYVANTKPSIRIDIIKEDIHPRKDVVKQPTTMPTVNQPYMGGGVQMDTGIDNGAVPGMETFDDFPE